MIMPTPSLLIVDDQLVAPEKAAISMDNRAFRYGDGLFETMLVLNGQVMRLDRHLARMLHGMSVLGFDFEVDKWEKKMRWAVDKLLEAPQLMFGPPTAKIRIQVWRGGGGTYVPEYDRPAYYAALSPFLYDPNAGLTPLRVGIYDEIPVVYTRLSAVKTLNAQPRILAARAAKLAGWDDALMVNVHGEIAESTKANLFGVKGGALWTPPLDSGCLPGTMRAEVLDVTGEIGLEIREAVFLPELLSDFDCLFLSNALRGTMVIGEVVGSGYALGSDEVREKINRRLNS